MATIERYETGSGATRYRVRYTTTNRRQTDERGFRTKRDAEAWANQLEVDKRRGSYVAPAAGRVQLGEYAQDWLNSKHALKPSTRSRYQVVFGHGDRSARWPKSGGHQPPIRAGVGRGTSNGDGACVGTQDGQGVAPGARNGGR